MTSYICNRQQASMNNKPSVLPLILWYEQINHIPLYQLVNYSNYNMEEGKKKNY